MVFVLQMIFCIIIVQRIFFLHIDLVDVLQQPFLQNIQAAKRSIRRKTVILAYILNKYCIRFEIMRLDWLRNSILSKNTGIKSKGNFNTLKLLKRLRVLLNFGQTLRKNYWYSELFWSVFSRIWTDYGEIRSISLYSVQMREIADQNNSEHGHFLRSES